MHSTFNSRVKDAGARSVIWAFVGALFGVLFVAAQQGLKGISGPLDSLILASACAGAVGALIYSSMRLAVVTAGVTTVLLVALQLTRGIGSQRLAGPVDVALWLGAATVVGALVGAYYGYASPASRVNRAMAKTLAGLIAGGAAGFLWWVVLQSAGSAPLWLTVGVLVPAVGWSYVFLATYFVRWGGRWLPRVVDAALVGVAVANVVVLGYWVVAASVNPALVGDGGLDPALMAQLPEALVAGAGGGMVAGLVRGMLGFGWYDL
jgi:hypothetical protein